MSHKVCSTLAQNKIIEESVADIWDNLTMIIDEFLWIHDTVVETRPPRVQPCSSQRNKDERQAEMVWEKPRF